jgi:very-short-patch-repair endonuclease
MSGSSHTSDHSLDFGGSTTARVDFSPKSGVWITQLGQLAFPARCRGVEYQRWMAVARRQGGVLSRDQCRGAGLTPREVDGLLRRGALLRMGSGVLRLAGAPFSEDTRHWHAVLATRGVLIASSAAYLWQLLEHPPAQVQIAVGSQRRVHGPAGVRVRRLDIPDRELTTRFRLPITTRARAAIDHLADCPLTEAVPFADRALAQGWFTIADLQRRLGRPVRGNARLRQVARTLMVGAEAESERRLQRLLRRHGIVGWVANHPLLVDGRLIARIDIAFPAQRLAIEVDGLAYHADRVRFQRDRTRQNDMVNLGWTVLRFTWQDITADPEQVIAVVRRALHRISED